MFAANLVILNANVVTLNPKQPRAQAVAVKDGRIVAVGFNDDVDRYVDDETRVVNVEGKTVVPGFVDCHAHMTVFGLRLQALDLHDVAKLTVAELESACVKACQGAVEEGLTGVHWIIDSGEEMRTIQKLRLEGKLPLRVYVGVPAKLLDEAARLGLFTGFGDDMLKLGFVKVFADGFLRTGTAALKEPYSDKPETSGVMRISQRKLNSFVLKAHRAGWQLAVHAVGDRAIEAVLKAFSKAIKKYPDIKHRHRIEHCSVLNPQLIKRMKRLGLVASIQPHFVVSNSWVAERVGVKRARWVYPFKSLIKAGVVVVSGSDCPFKPVSRFWVFGLL